MFLKVYFKNNVSEIIEFSDEEFLKILVEIEDYISDNFYNNEIDEKIENIRIDKSGVEIDVEKYFQKGYKLNKNLLIKKLKKTISRFETVKKGTYESFLCNMKSDQKLKVNWSLFEIHTLKRRTS